MADGKKAGLFAGGSVLTMGVLRGILILARVAMQPAPAPATIPGIDLSTLVHYDASVDAAHAIVAGARSPLAGRAVVARSTVAHAVLGADGRFTTFQCDGECRSEVTWGMHRLEVQGPPGPMDVRWTPGR